MSIARPDQSADTRDVGLRRLEDLLTILEAEPHKAADLDADAILLVRELLDSNTRNERCIYGDASCTYGWQESSSNSKPSAGETQPTGTFAKRSFRE